MEPLEFWSSPRKVRGDFMWRFGRDYHEIINESDVGAGCPLLNIAMLYCMNRFYPDITFFKQYLACFEQAEPLPANSTHDFSIYSINNYPDILFNLAETEARMRTGAISKRSEYTKVYEGHLANVLRDHNKLFFPLFFPLKGWKAKYCTTDVCGIAKTIWETNNIGLRGILKDALLDAGCEEPDVFAHINSRYFNHRTWLLEQLQ
jgi:hypothetical protein